VIVSPDNPPAIENGGEALSLPTALSRELNLIARRLEVLELVVVQTLDVEPITMMIQERSFRKLVSKRLLTETPFVYARCACLERYFATVG
jgi:hypothetical protein